VSISAPRSWRQSNGNVPYIKLIVNLLYCIMVLLMFTNRLKGALQAVRLVGSTLATEGRLEVNYDGIWGTVCDDLFDDVDASVACYMLGFR